MKIHIHIYIYIINLLHAINSSRKNELLHEHVGKDKSKGVFGSYQLCQLWIGASLHAH